jgi:hypothetical protein
VTETRPYRAIERHSHAQRLLRPPEPGWGTAGVILLLSLTAVADPTWWR